MSKYAIHARHHVRGCTQKPSPIQPGEVYVSLVPRFRPLIIVPVDYIGPGNYSGVGVEARYCPWCGERVDP